MDTLEFVAIERTGDIATVTIQRPDKLNALNPRVLADLDRAFRSLVEEPVRCAILTGAGKAFVAGADIAEMAGMSPALAKRFADVGQAFCARLEALPFPVIAAVNGFALGGGCEIALACDFIYAAEGAKLGQPEVNLGVIPGFGGTQRLLRRVGAARARELVYTGDMVTAEQALSMGLVNAVFPGPELLLRARRS
jgi:enoyl-CoA hydratase